MVGITRSKVVCRFSKLCADDFPGDFSARNAGLPEGTSVGNYELLVTINHRYLFIYLYIYIHMYLYIYTCVHTIVHMYPLFAILTHSKLKPFQKKHY